MSFSKTLFLPSVIAASAVAAFATANATDISASRSASEVESCSITRHVDRDTLDETYTFECHLTNGGF